MADATPEAPPGPKPPPAKDARQDFIPGDPLGSRFGESSLANPDPLGERITTLAIKGVAPGPNVDERNRSQRAELASILLVLAAVAVAALWLYWRSGHLNFAGQARNRE